MGSNGQPNDPQLLQAGRVRIWIQAGVANPSLPITYFGLLELQKLDQDLGKKTPIWVPSSTVRNRWDIADSLIASPALITTGFLQHANRYLPEKWWALQRTGCDFNVHILNSNCARPDDPSQWDSKVILGRTRLEKIGLPVLNPMDGTKNVVVDINGDLTAQTMDVVYPLAFQQVGSVIAVAEIIDSFYYDAIQCGDCGAVSDGCQKVYALQVANAGSPGLSSQLLYAADGGYTWAEIDIPTLGGLSASRMCPMGIYCLVVSVNQGAYHYAKFSDINAGTTNWTQITTGFTAGKSPKCIVARDPNTCWIGAQGGVIYSLTYVGNAVTVVVDGSQSSQDVNDIHFYGTTVVAVMNSNAILYSQNSGNNWTLVTGPVVGQNLSAIWCVSPITWFVATGNGQLWYTTNAGTSWTRVQLDAGITTIDDLQMYNDQIGYLAVEIAGAARVYRTTDGGNTWRYTPASEIGALPSAPVRIDVIAPCGPNTVLAVGRKTVGGSGYMALARTTTQ